MTLKPQLSRRRLLASTAAGAGLAAAPWLRGVAAQDKPAELIVRAWGGVWVEALEKGVSRPFTEQTGIAVRHDLTETRPEPTRARRRAQRPRRHRRLGRGRVVDQGRAPPIHVNWDTSTNATKSALRGVTEDLGDLPNLKDMLPAAKPAGFDGVPLLSCTPTSTSWPTATRRSRAAPRTAGRSCSTRSSRADRALRRHRLPPGGRDPGRRHHGRHPANMQPAWDFLAKLKQQSPLLGEDPDHLVPERRDRRRLHHPEQRPRRQAERDRGFLDRAEGGAKVDTDGMWVPKGLRRASSTGPRST